MTMRILLLLALLAPVLAPSPARAHAHDDDPLGSISFGDVRDPARLGPRHVGDEARTGIDSRDRELTLVLTRDLVALQLSDATMHRIDRKLREERTRHEDNAISDAVKGAILGGVAALLDHAFECDVRDLREVVVRDGRLDIVARDGSRPFDSITVDERRAVECFDLRDAEAFARACQHAIATHR